MQPPLTIADLTWVRPDWGQALLESVQRLERSLDSIRGRALRRTAVCSSLESLNADALVAVLVLLSDRARHGNGRARAVLQELALEPTLFIELPYARVQAAYALALAHGHDPVAQMFMSAVEHQNPTIDEAFTGNDHLDAPAGVRRSAARSSDRYKLDRLLHDRDWRVIKTLLDNPRITESDVVKIAAMRPTRKEILETIARHRRWASRYAIRKALCFNPYTPAPVARRLLPTMLRQDLERLLEVGSASKPMRQHAQKLLAEPERPPQPEGPWTAVIDLTNEDADVSLETLIQELGETSDPASQPE